MASPAPDRFELLRALARRVPGAMALLRGARRRLDPDLRAIAAAGARHGDVLLQPFPTTGEDRYPALFDALAARLDGLAAPRVLSFGCASGEEVRALRARLPHAWIDGLDLNARALAQARAADPHPRSRYLEAGAPEPAARYDAIVALAVLRHGVLEAERPASCTAVLPFARFAAALAALDAALVPGGWLAMGHAHFRLADTALAGNYETDPGVTLPCPHVLYGPDDRRIERFDAPAVLFRKRG